MDNFLLNLLKVSAGTTLFYLCYLLFFSKDTFYLRNRIFLILTLLLPLFIPVLRIPVLSTTTAVAPTFNTFDSSGISETSLQPIIQSTVNSPDYNRLLIWLYLAITGFFLLKIFISLISTYRIIGKGKVESDSFPKIVISKAQLPPFSFFPFAVIPEEHFTSGNCTDILDHEFAHIRQGHTFDLLISEIFIAFQWFNPFVWLIKRSIVLNHEYLADHVSLSGHRSVKEYQYRLLNFQSGFKNISLAHSFNNLIKNRIIMINKKPSRKYAMLKNILILPAVAFVIYAFATPKYYYKTASQNEASLVLNTENQVPVPTHNSVKGFVINKFGKYFENASITVSGEKKVVTTDNMGYFIIENLDESASLTFSYKGYKPQVLKPDFTHGMLVKLEKEPSGQTGMDASQFPAAIPLMVIDGVVEEGTTMAEIDPLKVTSLTVLNDKAAVDKWGEKGKHGVIEIISTRTDKNIPYTKLSTEEFKAQSLILIDGKVYTGELNDISQNEVSSISVKNYTAAYDKYGVKDKEKVIEIITKKNSQDIGKNNTEGMKIEQKEVKGIVTSADGKPIEGVNITSTGTLGNAFMATSGKDGRFSIANVQSDAMLSFSCRGYKWLSLKPDFSKEMTVKMELNPEDKLPAGINPNAPQPLRKEPLVVIDGVMSDKNPSEVRKELGYDMGIPKLLFGKEATDKYGEKGANGVYEIITRKKALAMGLKPPFIRLAPQDYPTFQNMKFSDFSAWVASQAKYPAEAQTKKAEGWVSVNFKIELDGSLSNVVSTSGMVDPLLINEIIRVIKSSPKWDGPVNKDVDEPFTSSVTLRFKLPDQILDDAPFVMVQEMPMYPGGAVELLNFIKNNTKYPEVAEANKIEGRVVVRFVVNTEGKVEGISVLKGVDPMLDAEAVRVVSLLPAFKPGMQAGKPVNVWYMVPVGFKLTVRQADFKKSSLADILKFIQSNTKYPQEAKNTQETGEVFVVLKLGKGGIIKECRAAIDKFSFSAPLMPEVVVVSYKPKPDQNAAQNVRMAGGENPALKAECERVARLLTVKEIPDWNDKDLEFALDFKFILK